MKNGLLSSQKTSLPNAHGCPGRRVASARTSQKTTSTNLSSRPMDRSGRPFVTQCHAGPVEARKENDYE